MKIGKVIAQAEMERSAECMRGERLLLVEMEGTTVTALDRTQAQPGDHVLLVLGHAASRYSMDAPADAVAAAVMKPWKS